SWLALMAEEGPPAEGEELGRVGKRTVYKNYTIWSTPDYHPASRQLSLSIVIQWERDGTVTARPFSVKNAYQTKAEADLHGIAYGQLIIDGQVRGSSVG